MGFDIKVTVAKMDYDEKSIATIMAATNETLIDFRLAIDSEVDEKDYINNISSKEINRYVRVSSNKLTSQKEDKEQLLIKYGSGKYSDFEVFRNSKYASISISKMNDMLVIWHNFSNKIAGIKPTFDDMSFIFGQKLSHMTNSESMVFKANTFSRQDDLFGMYHNGTLKFSASKKSALTDVKATYGIDINDVMDNIDRNIAIHHAVDDYITINHMIKELNSKIKAMEAMMDEQGEMLGPDGTPLTSSFIAEHKAMMARYLLDKELINKTMKEDPIGCIKFFRMKSLNTLMNPIEGGVRPE